MGEADDKISSTGKRQHKSVEKNLEENQETPKSTNLEKKGKPLKVNLLKLCFARYSGVMWLYCILKSEKYCPGDI